MHQQRETLLIDSPNPSYSHLVKYRFDNLTHEQSPTTTSRFSGRRGTMRIAAGFTVAIFVALFFVGIHGQTKPYNILTNGYSQQPVPTLPSQSTPNSFKITTSRPLGHECVLYSKGNTMNLKQYTGNISDTCLPGEKSKMCVTWRMTNAFVMKDADNIQNFISPISEFLNETSASCSTKNQIQFLFETTINDDVNHIYYFATTAFQRIIAKFNSSRALISSKLDKKGDAMYIVLAGFTDSLNKNPVLMDGAVLNIFTDLTYVELCESPLFMGTFSDKLSKLIDSGFVVKFFFLNQDLQSSQNKANVENVLAGCKYRNSKTFCEIVDSQNQLDDPDDYAICLDPNPAKKNNEDFNWHLTELLLIIGIPCVSLTVCCIAFFICFLKCAKLKMAMMRMRLFGNDAPRTREEMELKKKWLAQRVVKEFDLECKDGGQPEWSHFASANNYMDIQALAKANKKDVWEIDTKNLLVQEDHLLGNGAFANVFKGIVKGKIPLLVVNNSLNLIVESEHNGHFEAAVKKLPAHADEQNHLDFFHEIDFMKRLGHHPHVISMLGCVSNPYEPLIVVEYCQRGDLLKFLRRHKDYVLLNKTDDCPVEADMCLRIKDLVSIAWQVADGMSYLASKNFIHRDLAARNILLTKSLTAKVSDFGLCRYMDSALYTAKGGRLPIKWMSIEALKLYEFSSKSDVWSFGVLLFEIFSMGDVPYPTIQQVDMLEHLLAGGRLTQPIKCPNEIYNIMVKCWAENPEQRPEFNEMRGEITVMLNLDDESYGYLSVQSDDGLPKYTSLTMQDSKETVPCSSQGGSQEMDEDGEYDSGSDDTHSQATCTQLDRVLSERFGEEQGQEIKQIFCEVKEQMGRIKRVKSTHSNSTNRS